MGHHIRNPKNFRFKSGSNETLFSFSYPDNKFQIDKIQIFEVKNQEIIIKKKNRHKHLDYGINDFSDGLDIDEKFHERNQIKYEETKQKNRTKHRINYECKIAGGKKPKEDVENNDISNEIKKDEIILDEEEFFSEPDMDFNDLFELSASVCCVESSDDEDTKNDD